MLKNNWGEFYQTIPNPGTTISTKNEEVFANGLPRKTHFHTYLDKVQMTSFMALSKFTRKRKHAHE